MNHKFLSAGAAALAICIMFAGCGKQNSPETTLAPETNVPSESTDAPRGSDPLDTMHSTDSPAGSEDTQPTGNSERDASVYIGTAAGGFREYPVELGGPLSPESLIEAMETLTGWNLSLSEPVSMGKGGMTVIFSGESSLLVGPPVEQKEEFRLLDVDTLVITVLDSIQQTLQQSYVADGGDPNSLDIYFSIENGDIEIPGTNLHYSQYEPWDSARLTH